MGAATGIGNLNDLLSFTPRLVADQDPPTILHHMEMEFQAGQMSLKEYLINRINVLKDPTKIPPRFQRKYRFSAFPTLCATGLVMENMELAQFLPEAQREEYMSIATARPDRSFSVTAGSTGVQVHYRSASERSTALLIASYVQENITTQVNSWGFRTFLPDNGVEGSDDYDVYLLPPGSQDFTYGGYVLPEDFVLSNGITACTSHMVLNSAMAFDAIRYTTAHEFQHVFQLASDCTDGRWYLESGATFVEEQLFRNGHNAAPVINEYQAAPQLPFDTFIQGSGFPYGGAMFWKILAERFDGQQGFGIDLYRDSWRNSENPFTGSNEPDIVDALDEALRNRAGVGFLDGLREFAALRYLVGNNANYWPWHEDMSIYSRPPNIASFSGVSLPLVDWSPNPSDRPYITGTNYIIFNPGGTNETLRIELESIPVNGIGSSYIASAVVVPFFGETKIVPMTMTEDTVFIPGSPIQIEVDIQRGVLTVDNFSASVLRTVILAVTHMGPVGTVFDPDQASDNARGNYKLNVSRGFFDATPTPGPATPTPMPVSEPKVLLAGYGTTDVAASKNNTIEIVALVDDPAGTVSGVSLLDGGAASGVTLAPQGGDLYTWGVSGVDLPGAAGVQALFGLAADDGSGQLSAPWPYLTVEP